MIQSSKSNKQPPVKPVIEDQIKTDALSPTVHMPYTKKVAPPRQSTLQSPIFKIERLSQ